MFPVWGAFLSGLSSDIFFNENVMSIRPATVKRYPE
jgi:hypothetical protein